MQLKSLLPLFLSFFLLLTFRLEAAIRPNSGTLIVSYQSGPRAERLNRIRFWLKSQQFGAQLYPKGNNYVDDQSNMVRMVVLENLPPDKYSLEFVVPNADGLFEATPRREVLVQAGKVVKIDQVIKPRYASLKVKTSFDSDKDLPDHFPKIHLQNAQGETVVPSTESHFLAKYLVPGKYIVVFEKLPGFVAPPAMELSLGPNQNFGPIEGVYIHESTATHPTLDKAYQETFFDVTQKTVLVPEGKAIIGDPFSDNLENELSAKTVKISSFYIGIYEITNFQFAQWLTKAVKEAKIVYHIDRGREGQVTDNEGHLLFKTQKADPYSQIFAEISQDKIQFFPQPGKSKHPVVNVTWWGAQAYCKDNQCRLPTEAEWEKAAGMVLSLPEQPLKKYRFGFSRDTINRTWANYNDSSRDRKVFAVDTTPVGFYNGINKLSGWERSEDKITNHAVSPVGAYDMSGNVWEWVADWYDVNYYKNMPANDPQGPSSGTLKVAKGGCYDSFADGVRVAERIGLRPDHADPFTGFRIALEK
jgi:formylglycine-generating enzyme required for sulfatase activity